MSSNKKLAINDLVNALKKPSISTEVTNESSKITNIEKKAKKLTSKKVAQELKMSSLEAKKLLRQANREVVNKKVSKWQNVVKRNREKEYIDFTAREKGEAFRIGDKSIKDKSNKYKPFEQKISKKLKSINMDSEDALVQKEQKLLAYDASAQERSKYSESIREKNL